MKYLLGYDNRGKIFDAGNIILRKINSDYISETKINYYVYEKNKLFDKGIVNTQLDFKKATLQHKKHIISYPYEWTANMFKDALIFHLELFLLLDKSNMTLKDGLPNNILFDFTNPVFVDFFSLIFTSSLYKETWLNSKEYMDNRFAVLDKMFFPFFIIPFLAFYEKKNNLARNMLSYKSCNCKEDSPKWVDLKNYTRKTFFLFFKKKIETYSELKRIQNSFKKNNNYNKTLKKIITDLKTKDVSPKKSGYSDYYKFKNEDFNLNDKTNWTSKQKNFFSLIYELKPKRVLDIGSNTGWFSLLAEKLGAEVISTDNDESSIDILYQTSKNNKLKILPLFLSFDDLNKEIYGVSYDDRCYSDIDFNKIPLYLSPLYRLQSDVVLCLGLLHHLILGMDKDIDDVMKILYSLSKKYLIIEFVDINDKLIQDEPTFFKNLYKYSEENYNLQIIIKTALNYFKSYRTLDSYPESRVLIVFNK